MHPKTAIKLANSLKTFTKEAQLRQIIFDSELEKCEFCHKKWNKRGTISSIFVLLRTWIDEGNCSKARRGIDPFEKTMHEAQFMLCAGEWI